MVAGGAGTYRHGRSFVLLHCRTYQEKRRAEKHTKKSTNRESLKKKKDTTGFRDRFKNKVSGDLKRGWFLEMYRWGAVVPEVLGEDHSRLENYRRERVTPRGSQIDVKIRKGGDRGG